MFLDKYKKVIGKKYNKKNGNFLFDISQLIKQPEQVKL